MSEDAKTLIEQAVRSFLEEVPALKPMTLVVGVDLHGRGDTQQFRVELPEVSVRKDIAADARVRLDMRRDFFNLMVEHGAKVADWREAFENGRAKATRRRSVPEADRQRHRAPGGAQPDPPRTALSARRVQGLLGGVRGA